MAALVVVLGIFMCKLNVVRAGQGGCGSKANFRSGRCQQRDRPSTLGAFLGASVYRYLERGMRKLLGRALAGRGSLSWARAGACAEQRG